MPGQSYAIQKRTVFRGTGYNLSLEHNTAPEMRFVEMDQTDPSGRWRLLANSGSLSFQGATSAEWAEFSTILKLATGNSEILGGHHLKGSNSTPWGLEFTQATLVVGSLGTLVLPVKTDTGAPNDAAGGNLDGSIVYNSFDNTIEIRDGSDTYLSVAVAGVVLQRMAPALGSGDGL